MAIADDLAKLVELAGVYPPRQRILITGGTGFVGSRLADVLTNAGHTVTIVGRSKYRVRSDGDFVAADVTSPSDMSSVCADKDIVFHSAALTSAWGSLEEHRRVNTQGTQNVVDACVEHQVRRVVHVSSTAIFFEYRDRRDLTDDAGFPKKFSCHYAQTKAESETIVRGAIEQGLNGYIVRARAVFGPGDNVLLPRLIEAARQGRLRQIGAGKNFCDLTYVDNLIAGLIRAGNPDGPQGLCTITNEEPLDLWDTVRNIVKEVTGKELQGRVPYWLAMRVAHLIELGHTIRSKPGEPAVTRYGVGLLAKHQTFVSAAANEELGYRPLVSVGEGIERTIEDLRARREVPLPDQTTVTVKFFSTGYVAFRRHLAERGASKEMTRFHTTVAMITHPVHGITLFDTGHSMRFFDATKRMPYRLYRYATKVFSDPQWGIEKWLERDGIAADDVQSVVISHFHADHIGGLRAFPNADFVSTEKAWENVRTRKGIGAVKRAFLPDLLPEDFPERIHTIGQFHAPGFGPLSRSHDLFRDGSVRMFDLDGHAIGQCGLLLQLAGGRQMFLLADAFWSAPEIDQELKPSFGFRLIAENVSAALKTRAAIVQIAKSHPEVEMVCNHCPDFSKTQRFDERMQEVLKTQHV